MPDGVFAGFGDGEGALVWCGEAYEFFGLGKMDKGDDGEGCDADAETGEYEYASYEEYHGRSPFRGGEWVFLRGLMNDEFEMAGCVCSDLAAEVQIDGCADILRDGDDHSLAEVLHQVEAAAARVEQAELVIVPVNASGYALGIEAAAVVFDLEVKPLGGQGGGYVDVIIFMQAGEV